MYLCEDQISGRRVGQQRADLRDKSETGKDGAVVTAELDVRLDVKDFAALSEPRLLNDRCYVVPTHVHESTEGMRLDAGRNHAGSEARQNRYRASVDRDTIAHQVCANLNERTLSSSARL